MAKRNIDRIVNFLGRQGVSIPDNVNLTKLNNYNSFAPYLSDPHAAPMARRSINAMFNQNLTPTRLISQARGLMGSSLAGTRAEEMLRSGVNLADKRQAAVGTLTELSNKIHRIGWEGGIGSLRGAFEGIETAQLDIAATKDAERINRRTGNDLYTQTANIHGMLDKINTYKGTTGKSGSYGGSSLSERVGLMKQYSGLKGLKEHQIAGLQSDLGNLKNPFGADKGDATQFTQAIKDLQKQAKALGDEFDKLNKKVAESAKKYDAVGGMVSDAGGLVKSWGSTLPTNILSVQASMANTMYNRRFDDVLSGAYGKDVASLGRIGFSSTALSSAKSARGFERAGGVLDAAGKATSMLMGSPGNLALLAGGAALAGTGIGAPIGIGMMALGGANIGTDLYSNWNVGSQYGGIKRYSAQMENFNAKNYQTFKKQQMGIDAVFNAYSQGSAAGFGAGIDPALFNFKMGPRMKSPTPYAQDRLVTLTSSFKAASYDKNITYNIYDKAETSPLYSPGQTVTGARWAERQTTSTYSSAASKYGLMPEEASAAGPGYFAAMGGRSGGPGAIAAAGMLKNMGMSLSSAAPYMNQLSLMGQNNGWDSMVNLIGNLPHANQFMLSQMTSLTGQASASANASGYDVSGEAMRMVRNLTPGNSNFDYTRAKAALGFFDDRQSRGKSGTDLPQVLSQLGNYNKAGFTGSAVLQGMSMASLNSLMKMDSGGLTLYSQYWGGTGFGKEQIQSAAKQARAGQLMTFGDLIYGTSSIVNRYASGGRNAISASEYSKANQVRALQGYGRLDDQVDMATKDTELGKELKQSISEAMKEANIASADLMSKVLESALAKFNGNMEALLQSKVTSILEKIDGNGTIDSLDLGAQSAAMNGEMTVSAGVVNVYQR